MDVVRKIENTETQSGDRPKADVVIDKAGYIPVRFKTLTCTFKVETPFSVEKSDA